MNGVTVTNCMLSQLTCSFFMRINNHHQECYYYAKKVLDENPKVDNYLMIGHFEVVEGPLSELCVIYISDY